MTESLPTDRGDTMSNKKHVWLSAGAATVVSGLEARIAELEARNAALAQLISRWRNAAKDRRQRIAELEAERDRLKLIVDRVMRPGVIEGAMIAGDMGVTVGTRSDAIRAAIRARPAP